MMDAPGFNAWHADVADSPACALIFQRALGLPAQVVSNSLLPGAGLAEVAAALRVAPGQILVDLACGRGGYGREVARRTGARLAGLDFSAAAVTIAARGRPRGRARFCVGDFTALGLRYHSADAVMCIDAIQFSDPPAAALRECRRILAGEGRLAVTAWEPRGPVPDGVPERIRRMNLARDLAGAGFEEIEVTEKPHWYAAERTLWQAASRPAPAATRHWSHCRKKPPRRWPPSTSGAAPWPRPGPPRPKPYSEHPFRTPEARNEACQPFRSASHRIADSVATNGLG